MTTKSEAEVVETPDTLEDYTDREAKVYRELVDVINDNQGKLTVVSIIGLLDTLKYNIMKVQSAD